MTINCAVPVLAVRSALPANVAVSVRPFGTAEVMEITQLAVPAVEPGTGVQMPLLDKTSLATEDVSAMAASALGSIIVTTSAAINVIVAVEDCPTTIELGESVTVIEVRSGKTVSVPLTSEIA